MAEPKKSDGRDSGRRVVEGVGGSAGNRLLDSLLASSFLPVQPKLKLQGREGLKKER